MHYCAIIITESKSINKSAEAAERGRMMSDFKILNYILEDEGYSQNEIRNLIFNGTMAFEKEEFIRFFESYMKEWNCDISEIEAFRNMIEYDDCPINWFVEEFDGKTYYLNICA